MYAVEVWLRDLVCHQRYVTECSQPYAIAKIFHNSSFDKRRRASSVPASLWPVALSAATPRAIRVHSRARSVSATYTATATATAAIAPVAEAVPAVLVIGLCAAGVVGAGLRWSSRIVLAAWLPPALLTLAVFRCTRVGVLVHLHRDVAHGVDHDGERFVAWHLLGVVAVRMS